MITAFLIVVIVLSAAGLVTIAFLCRRGGEPGWRTLEAAPPPEAVAAQEEQTEHPWRVWAQMQGAGGTLASFIGMLVHIVTAVCLVVVAVWLAISLFWWFDAKLSEWHQKAQELALRNVPPVQPAPTVTPSLEERAVVHSWMNEHSSPSAENSWKQTLLNHQYKRVWQPGEEGYMALPINVALVRGGRIRTKTLVTQWQDPDEDDAEKQGSQKTLQRRSERAGSYLVAGIHDQHLGTVSATGYRRPLLSALGGTAPIQPDMSVLFVRVEQPPPTAPGPIGLAFEIGVELPENVGLRIARHRVFTPQTDQDWEHATFGLLPFTIDEAEITWTVQINFVPYSENGVVDRQTIGPDYYATRHHEVALVADVEEPETGTRVVHGPIKVHQDTYQISSQDIRQTWNPDQAPDSAWLNIAVDDQFLVYVVVLFR
jgi:hypothetical protein